MLRKNENKRTENTNYRELYENAHDPILIYSLPDLMILDANSAAFKIYGYDRNELIGLSLNNLSTDADAIKKNSKKLSEEKVYMKFETVHKSKSGKLIDFEVNATLFNYKGKLVILAIHRDISKRKKLEEDLINAKIKAEKSDRLKSEFLAQMSHEIRTPVNTMLSFTSLLKSELYDMLDEDQKDSFSLIESGGKRLIRTVDSLLTMAQIQSGNYEIKKEEVDLSNDIISSIYESYKPTAKSKNLEFRVIKGSENFKVTADDYSLRQLFTNLVDNAIKYTDSGFVEIRMFRDNSNNTKVTVKDSGIGISKEYQSKLFIPFSQEDSGYSRKYEGSGMGLALVKHYCEINNLQISLESDKNKGAAFTVTFPEKNVF